MNSIHTASHIKTGHAIHRPYESVSTEKLVAMVTAKIADFRWRHSSAKRTKRAMLARIEIEKMGAELMCRDGTVGDDFISAYQDAIGDLPATVYLEVLACKASKAEKG